MSLNAQPAAETVPDTVDCEFGTSMNALTGPAPAPFATVKVEVVIEGSPAAVTAVTVSVCVPLESSVVSTGKLHPTFGHPTVAGKAAHTSVRDPMAAFVACGSPSIESETVASGLLLLAAQP